jgi:hypothetical protein
VWAYGRRCVAGSKSRVTWVRVGGAPARSRSVLEQAGGRAPAVAK